MERLGISIHQEKGATTPEATPHRSTPSTEVDTDVIEIPHLDPEGDNQAEHNHEDSASHDQAEHHTQEEQDHHTTQEEPVVVASKPQPNNDQATTEESSSQSAL